jgi:hypothetical protein
MKTIRETKAEIRNFRQAVLAVTIFMAALLTVVAVMANIN